MQADVAETSPGPYIAADLAQFSAAFALVTHTAAFFRSLVPVAGVRTCVAVLLRVLRFACRGGASRSVQKGRLFQGLQIIDAVIGFLCHGASLAPQVLTVDSEQLDQDEMCGDF